MTIQTHKDLDVWKLGIDLVEIIYQVTNAFPKDESYGLSSQLRRASISVPSNIAEGYARQSKKELIHFLYISLGSLSEIETQIIISNRLHYLEDKESISSLVETIRMKLLKLIKYHKKTL